MTTLMLSQVGAVGRRWRDVVLNHGEGDINPTMWLVTVPAVALAVTTSPVVRISANPWINRLGLFVGMVILATLYAVPVMAVIQRVATRRRIPQILLSCWWVGAGAAVWIPAGWLAAMVGGAGAALLLHLMVRQVEAVRLRS